MDNELSQTKRFYADLRDDVKDLYLCLNDPVLFKSKLEKLEEKGEIHHPPIRKKETRTVREKIK